MPIKSPLSAIWAVVVLIQAISASALFAIHDDIVLQRILVGLIAAISIALTILVIWLVTYLAHHYPAFLFNPKDIDPSAHYDLYTLRTDKDKIEAKLEDGKSKVNQEAI